MLGHVLACFCLRKHSYDIYCKVGRCIAVVLLKSTRCQCQLGYLVATTTTTTKSVVSESIHVLTLLTLLQINRSLSF